MRSGGAIRFYLFEGGRRLLADGDRGDRREKRGEGSARRARSSLDIFRACACPRYLLPPRSGQSRDGPASRPAPDRERAGCAAAASRAPRSAKQSSAHPVGGGSAACDQRTSHPSQRCRETLVDNSARRLGSVPPCCANSESPTFLVMTCASSSLAFSETANAALSVNSRRSPHTYRTRFITS